MIVYEIQTESELRVHQHFEFDYEEKMNDLMDYYQTHMHFEVFPWHQLNKIASRGPKLAGLGWAGEYKTLI